MQSSRPVRRVAELGSFGESMKLSLDLLFAIVLVVAGCATQGDRNSSDGLLPPEDLPNQLGSSAFPEKFRFISTNTTLQEVTQRLGPPDQTVGSGTQSYLYEMPNGTAVWLFPEWPYSLKSKVQRGVISITQRSSE